MLAVPPAQAQLQGLAQAPAQSEPASAAPALPSAATQTADEPEYRYALVIGNAGYPGSARLENPVNDARAVASALRALGFVVVELHDASRSQMQNAVLTLNGLLREKNAMAVFYYSGHGMQLNWRNYMLPVDLSPRSAADVIEQAVDLNTVISGFKSAGSRMNVMILDACRDNPFKSSLASGKGLAPMDAPAGTFLAYATAPGSDAEDGDNIDGKGNGLYTRFLLRELQVPGARIEDLFQRVRQSVRTQSAGRQIPWESTSLEQPFYFNDGVRYTFSKRQRERDLVPASDPDRERRRVMAAALVAERQLQAEARAAETRAAEARAIEARAAEARAIEARVAAFRAEQQRQAQAALQAADRESEVRVQQQALAQQRDEQARQAEATRTQHLESIAALREQQRQAFDARQRDQHRLADEAFLREREDARAMADAYDLLERSRVLPGPPLTPCCVPLSAR